MSAALRPLPAPAPSTIIASVYLHPGEVYVTGEPTRITTILGSCVSVCLFDARAGVAGLNHFLLPRAAIPADASPATATSR